MEQYLIEGIKHMRLTKEEEVQIVVSGEDKAEMLEQCALSMVGRLLTNRKQNQRALKNTLRLAWKASPNLRIVEVGNDIFQFKFSNECQLQWVETNGPWNLRIIYYFFKDGKEG